MRAIIAAHIYIFENISRSYAMLAYAVHACRMHALMFADLLPRPCAAASAPCVTAPAVAWARGFRTRRASVTPDAQRPRWKEEYLLEDWKLVDHGRGPVKNATEKGKPKCQCNEFYYITELDAKLKCAKRKRRAVVNNCLTAS